jgi:hypothetical protein
MYYSIPGVLKAALNLKDVDYSDIKNLSHGHADSHPSRPSQSQGKVKDDANKVTRRTRVYWATRNMEEYERDEYEVVMAHKRKIPSAGISRRERLRVPHSTQTTTKKRTHSPLTASRMAANNEFPATKANECGVQWNANRKASEKRFHKSLRFSHEKSEIELNEDACSSCFINLLHLRSHTVDTVVVGNTTMKEEDAAGMMDEDDMIDDAEDANMSDDGNNETKKPPPAPSVCQEEQPRYPSPSLEDITSEKPSSTPPPPLPRKRGDIISEPFESLSTSSSAAELQQSSSTSLSIPALSRFPPESILLSHLIITTNVEGDAPLLLLNSWNNNVNPNEADDMMMPQIRRINLQMRQSSNPTTSHHHHRVIETNNPNRFRPLATTTQQTIGTRQAEGRFVPIQQQDSREEDDEDEDEVL